MSGVMRRARLHSIHDVGTGAHQLYPDLGQVQTKFEALDVYCDTPFLLPAIGYSEEGRHLQSAELIELLEELGRGSSASTEEEVDGVLRAPRRSS